MSREMGVPLLRAEVGQFLRMMVGVHRPGSILEIGTGVGYSGHILLDRADAGCRLCTVELEEDRGKRARELFYESGFGDRVTVFLGDAKDIVPNMSGRFDLIFMDGPKSCYYTFLPDFLRMLNKGGLLICDNVLLMGNISGDSGVTKESTLMRNMRAFLREIQKPPWLSSVLDVGDGVSVSQLL